MRTKLSRNNAIKSWYRIISKRATNARLKFQISLLLLQQPKVSMNNTMLSLKEDKISSCLRTRKSSRSNNSHRRCCSKKLWCRQLQAYSREVNTAHPLQTPQLRPLEKSAQGARQSKLRALSWPNSMRQTQLQFRQAEMQKWLDSTNSRFIAITARIAQKVWASSLRIATLQTYLGSLKRKKAGTRIAFIIRRWPRIQWLVAP